MMKHYLLSGIAALLSCAALAQSPSLVKDINTNPGAGCQPGEVLKAGNLVFFRANDGNISNPDFELWKTDGTNAGTQKIVVNSGISSFPKNAAVVGASDDKLAFNAVGSGTGAELFIYNLSASSLSSVIDIYAGSNGSDPEGFTQIPGSADFVFAATNASGKQLYKSNGTSAGTTVITTSVADPANFAAYGNWVYFSADDGSGDVELWRTNGSTVSKVKDINASGSSFPSELVVFNNTLYFTADDGVNGVEVWKSDGSTAGTVMLKNINTTSGTGSNPSQLTVAGSKLFFVADDGNTGNELFYTDGTSAGTMVENIYPNNTSSNPNYLTPVGRLLFFAATRPAEGNELFYFDSDAEALYLAADVDNASTSTSPQYLTNAYGDLYFSASTAASGRETYVWSNSGPGATAVGDINTGAADANPKEFKVVGTELVFFADDGSNGTELYKVSLSNSPTIQPIADQVTDEDIPVNVSVTINSAISSTASLTLSASSTDTTLVGSNSVTFSGSGSSRTATITPKQYQNGSATVTIQVCDASNNCINTDFLLTVNSTPNAPVLSTVNRSVNEDNTLSFTSGDFDNKFSDAEGDNMDSIRVESLPANGVLINGSDTITSSDLNVSIVTSLIANLSFVPDTNWNGNTSFSWNAYGGGSWANSSATVSITVNAVNDAPVILSKPTKNVNEDNALSFSAADFNDASVYYDEEGTPLASVRINFLPRNGVLLNNTDTLGAADLPKVVAVANIPNLTYHPATNYNGQDYIRWSAGDGNKFSTADTFFFNVQAVNDLPVASNFSISVDEDSEYSFSALQFDSVYFDQEGAQLNKIQITTLPLNGTLTLSGNSITANAEINRSQIANFKFSPDLNFNGSTSFEFKVHDGTAYSAGTGVVSVTVNPVNDAPVADKVTKSGSEDIDVGFTVNNFRNRYSDIEGDTLQSIQITSLPANGGLTVDGVNITSGDLPHTIAFSAITQLVFDPSDNWFGTTYFKWKGYDGSDFSTVADTVEITLAPVNDNPVVYNFPQTVTEDDTLDIFIKDFTDNFTDVDGDTIVHHKITQLPKNGTLLVAGIAQGSVPLNISAAVLDQVSYVPDQDYTGPDTILYQGYDGQLYSNNTAQVRFTVEPVNDAPEISTISTSVDEDMIVNLLINNFTPGYTDIEGDPMQSVKIMSLPANGTLRLNNTPLQVNDVVNAAVIGNMTVTPAANFSGTTYFTWQASDGELFSTTDTFKIMVNPVNDKPSIAVPGTQVVQEDKIHAIYGISVADIDAGDSLVNLKLSVSDATMSLTQTTGLAFSAGDGTNDALMEFSGSLTDINAALDSVMYDPNTNFNGFDLMELILSDLGHNGAGGVKGDTATISVQVDGINDTTIFAVPGDTSVLEDNDLVLGGISLSDVDADNSNVRVSISAGHGHITLSSTALLTFLEGNGTQDSTMVFYGAISSVNPALNNLIYHSDVGYYGPDAINFSVVDSAQSSIATDNAQVGITVLPRPVSFTSDPLSQARCEGGNVSYSVAVDGTPPFQYQWIKDGINIPNATNSTLSLTGLDTSDAGIYTCLVTNADGFNLSDTALLTLYDKPDVDFAYSEPCTGTPVQFTDSTVVTGDTIQNYIWDMGDGTSFGTQNPLHTFSSANPFGVELIAVSNRGCSDTLTKNVLITPKPQVLYSVNEECKGDTTVFTNSSSATFGTLSYLWVFGDGDSSTVENSSHLYSSVGSYNATLYAYNNGKCQSSQTKTVGVNPNPNANFAHSNICFGEEAEFTNTSTISSGVNSYIWDFDDGAVSNNVSPTRTYASADTFNVKMVATSNEGCSDSLSKSVIVYPVPNAVFSAPSVCSVDTVQFSNASSVQFGGSAYAWNFDDGSTSTLQNPAHYYSSTGTYTPKLVVTGVFGCQDSVSKTVNVHPNPMAGFEAANVCDGQSVDFTNTSALVSGISSYTWHFGDGTTSANTSPTRLYSSDGDYQVKLVVASDQQCIDSVKKTVRVHPQPQIAFTTGNECKVDSVEMNNQSSISNGGFTAYWNFGDGQRDTVNTFNDPKVKYNTHGTYNITLRAVADSGCADTVTRQVEVYAMPTMNFNANDVCYGNTVNFQNTSSIPLGAVSYTWNFDDGTVTNNVSPSYNYSYADTFNVKLRGTSNLGCSDSITKQVVVKPFPIVGFSVDDECNGDSVSFVNNTTISGGTFTNQWKLGNGADTSAASFNYLYGSPGFYPVKLIVTGASGCIDSVSQNLSVHPVANISVTSQDVACNSVPSGQINVNTLGGTPPFLYSVNNGANYQSNSTFTGLAAGSYVIHTIDGNGCEAGYAGNPLNLSQSPPLVLSVDSVKPVDCFNTPTGFISASGSGGAVPYLFSIDSVGYQTSSNFGNLTNGGYTVTIKDANNCVATYDTIVAQPASPISSTFQSKNIKCYGDSTGWIAIQGSGSVGNYAYSINGGSSFSNDSLFTQLPAASYTMVVRDSNGCETTQGVALTEPASAVQMNVAGTTDVLCYGDNSGSVTLFANGGTGAIRFALNSKTNFTANTSFGNLSSGSYTAYARDFNGCMDSVTTSISQPASALLIDSIAVSDVECFNTPTGEVTLFATGGAPSYRYRLNNGTAQGNSAFTISSGGGYQVTVIDSNNCTTVDSVTVNEPAQLVLAIDGVTDETCEFDGTGEISVSATGGVSPYGYSVDDMTYISGNSISSLMNGAYTVYVRDDNNCKSTQTATVGSEQLLPESKFTHFLVGNSVSFSNTSTDADTYVWKFGDGDSSNAESPTHLYTNPAIYSVSLKAANTCGSDTLVKTINVNATSVDNVNGPQGVSIYPNPVVNRFSISGNLQLYGEDVLLQITDGSGKLVYREELAGKQSFQQNFDGARFGTGVYFVEIRGKEKTSKQKLIIGY